MAIEGGNPGTESGLQATRAPSPRFIQYNLLDGSAVSVNFHEMMGVSSRTQRPDLLTRLTS